MFQDVGLGEADFDAMCGMVSWAVCGTGRSREKLLEGSICNKSTRYNESQVKIWSNDTCLFTFSRDAQLNLDRNDKVQIGLKCKDIINWGRRVYLELQGFDCSFYYFVPSLVSLENVCMVAVKQERNHNFTNKITNCWCVFFSGY